MFDEIGSDLGLINRIMSSDPVHEILIWFSIAHPNSTLETVIIHVKSLDKSE